MYTYLKERIVCFFPGPKGSITSVQDHTARDALSNVFEICIGWITVQHVPKPLPIALPLKVSGDVGVVVDSIVELLRSLEEVFALADPIKKSRGVEEVRLVVPFVGERADFVP